MTRVDIHQHIWTGPLIDALQARRSRPFVRRDNGLTMLHCAAEQPYVIDVVSEAIERRAALVRQDGLDLAVIAISSPIGIEALRRDDALRLIDAYLDGVAELPSEFGAWGPIAVEGADPDDVDRLLARGCVGISLPAGALIGSERLWLLGPVLERVAARGVPLFVHPGPAPGDSPRDCSFGEPLWWSALTDYVAQMQAAWLRFVSSGRRDHPRLMVLFAMLAGGAPLLSERLETRAGPSVDLRNARIFYETSSYGPDAVEMMARRVGETQLLYGSDRPVVDPRTTGRDLRLQSNGAALVAQTAAAA